MLWIVLPVAALAIDVSVEIVVTIEIVIVIDLIVTVFPIAIAPVATPNAPSRSTQRDSRTPGQSRAWHIAWIGVRIIRIGRRSSSLHHRIIRRDIDNVGNWPAELSSPDRRWALFNFGYDLALVFRFPVP